MKLLNYLKLKIINLSNILLPFKNYTISYYFSRYGNNLQQIANGIIFANKNQFNFYVSNHNKINSFKMKLMINFHYLKKNIDFFILIILLIYHQIQFQFLNSMMQWKMFLKIQLKRI